MKKVLLSAFLALVVMAAAAQEMKKGKMDVYDLGSYKLHVYNTNDALGDASYIVEGKSGLVTMETPIFKDNAAEFEAYILSLKKPVEVIVSNYHLGGDDTHKLVMPEGMSAFVTGDIYGGMIKGFQSNFGDALVAMPTGKMEEIPFGSTQTWAGVTFAFSHGVTTDFPAANINIGGKAYYMHWTPMKSHLSPLQISSSAAIDAALVEAKNAKKSGCELFIGGHGGAAKMDAVEFKIAYLQTMKKALSKNKTAAAFVAAMKKAYPDIPMADNLTAVAQNLYK